MTSRSSEISSRGQLIAFKFKDFFPIGTKLGYGVSPTVSKPSMTVSLKTGRLSSSSEPPKQACTRVGRLLRPQCTLLRLPPRSAPTDERAPCRGHIHSETKGIAGDFRPEHGGPPPCTSPPPSGPPPPPPCSFCALMLPKASLISAPKTTQQRSKPTKEGFPSPAPQACDRKGAFRNPLAPQRTPLVSGSIVKCSARPSTRSSACEGVTVSS